MHISEGVLTAPVLVSGAALAAGGTAIGLKTLDYDRIMTAAMLTATFFVASLIHVPIGPGSIHLVLNGLLGVMLGWASFPAILTALLLQAVFFQYGGLTVLGVNTCIMAFPAVLCFYLTRPLLAKPAARAPAGFIAGASAVFLSALCLAAALIFTDEGFITTAKIAVAANLPVMVIEGFITMFAVTYIARVRPDILERNTP